MISYFVDIPVEQELAITALVIALVNLAVTALISYAPWLAFLEEYKEEFAMAASAVAVAALENWLPSAYPEISILAVALVLAILAAVGFVKKFSAARGATKLL